MASDIQVRPAAPEDVPAILEMVRELARFERLEHMVEATGEDVQQALFGARPYAEALVAELASQTVGFALFFHNYSTFLGKPGIYIEDLYVKPPFRGKGAGSALLRRVVAIAMERKCGRVEWATLNWNERAIRFYIGLGAKPLSDWGLFRLSGAALGALAPKPD